MCNPESVETFRVRTRHIYKMTNYVLMIFGFSALATFVVGQSYQELAKFMDPTKCASRQFAAFVIGDATKSDCGQKNDYFMAYYASTQNILQQDKTKPVPSGTYVVSRNCMVACVPTSSRGRHAEAAILPNIHNGFNIEDRRRKMFIITYLMPCSGGRSGTEHDCKSRIQSFCQKYPGLVTVVTSGTAYNGGTYFAGSQLDGGRLKTAFLRAGCIGFLKDISIPKLSTLQTLQVTQL